MSKMLLLVAAVLAGIIAFLVMNQDEGAVDVADYDPTLDEREDDLPDGPMLKATGAANRPPPDEADDDRPTRPAGPKMLDWLAGEVVDAKTGGPIPNAALRIEPARTPCPRLPTHKRPTGSALDPNGSTTPMRESVSGSSDGEGRFEIKRAEASGSGAVDLFVFAEGYVTGCLCALEGDTNLTIRLEPGKLIRGHVTDRVGRPIEGAVVMAMRPAGLPALPGTDGDATTDNEGRFTLKELGDQPVVVSVDHPHYVAHFTDPIQPGEDETLEVQLVPAWRLTFLLRSDDGEGIENPTVHWKTSGDPPAEDLDLLTASPVGPPARPNSELQSIVVRVPADRRTVDLEIKADGYHPWITKGEPLPPDGGERLFQVTLERDKTIGTLRVHLMDAEGEPIHYVDAGAQIAGLVWLGKPEDVPTAFVREPSEILTLPSIKAGRYLVRIAAPGYGPSEANVEVPPGRSADLELTLGPPARLRVRFMADRRVVVRFRILKDGRPVPAFPEDRETKQPSTAEQPELSAVPGGDGLVVSGLGSGPHTVEVTSEDLLPVSHTVTLEAGEIQEVAIEVQIR